MEPWTVESGAWTGRVVQIDFLINPRPSVPHSTNSTYYYSSPLQYSTTRLLLCSTPLALTRPYCTALHYCPALALSCTGIALALLHCPVLYILSYVGSALDPWSPLEPLTSPPQTVAAAYTVQLQLQ